MENNLNGSRRLQNRSGEVKKTSPSGGNNLSTPMKDTNDRRTDKTRLVIIIFTSLIFLCVYAIDPLQINYKVSIVEMFLFATLVTIDFAIPKARWIVLLFFSAYSIFLIVRYII